MAAAPEPRVSVANSAMTSAEVDPGWFSRASVRSWVSRLPSPSTMRAYSIWPASIIIPASCMALTKPRQALARSKFRHDVGRSRAWCTATAADGSR